MRLCSFYMDRGESYGLQLPGGDYLDLPRALAFFPSLAAELGLPREILGAPDLKSWLSFGEGGLALAARLQQRALEGALPAPCLLAASRVRLRAPIPNPGKIIAVGLNYRDHAEEQGVRVPDRPLIFAKFPSAVQDPECPIRLPPISHQVDAEAELCVIILKRGKGIREEEASSWIAGYCAGNDVSARDLQFSDKQWVRGKSLDTFAPFGPTLVTADEVGDPHRLRIQLRLNGALMQDSTTAHMIFSCYHLVSFISQAITLEAGDVIFTGTPAGVGVFRDPPVFLQPGDRVEVFVEKVGRLGNPVISA